MNRTPLRPVTDAQLLAFERDGAVILQQVVGHGWLVRLRAAIERDIAQPGRFVHVYEPEGGAGRFHGNLRTWESDPDFADYCRNSPLPGLAARFLRSDRINLFYDQLFVKEPGTANPTPWHNDQPFWPLKGWGVMSFWLALDPVTRDSGAVEFIAGSHKWNRWFQPRPFGKTVRDGYARNPMYEDIPDFEAARDQYEILSWDMEPGDVLAFHALTVHGAGGNLRSDVRRRGYTVRYAGSDVTYDPRIGSHEGLWNPALEAGDALDSAQYPAVFPPADRAAADPHGPGPAPTPGDAQGPSPR